MKNYRSYLLAGAAALSLGFVSAAQAADPIIYEQPPVMLPAAMYDWSGFYAGVTAGYVTGDADYSATFQGTPLGSGSFDMDGAFLGGVVGYNWQSGNIVFGVEGDLAWANIEGGEDNFGETISSEIDLMGSVRGRVGYAWDNILPYLTAGVAFAHNEVSVTDFGSDSNTHIGWTAGLGVEVGVTQNVSASLEYRYTDFGSEDYSFDGGVAAATGAGDFHTIGAALKWRFN